MPRHILFVCTGNTCRSPMAEALFRHCCDARGVAGVVCQSAGISACVGAPMSPPARVALGAARLRQASTESQALSRELVQWADLIVTMTVAQRRAVVALFPEAKARTRTLLSFQGDDADVDDPFGGDVDEYVACLERMRPALWALVQWLVDGGESARRPLVGGG